MYRLALIIFVVSEKKAFSLTLDPMGKIFQNASSLKLLGQLKPNCPGMIIGKFLRRRHLKFSHRVQC
jgi:hypothetical protein